MIVVPTVMIPERKIVYLIILQASHVHGAVQKYLQCWLRACKFIFKSIICA